MSDSIQHYFPAGLAGHFGVPPNQRKSKKAARIQSRQHIVSVATRGEDEIREMPASKVGYSSKTPRPYDFVMTDDNSTQSVDHLWDLPERNVGRLVRYLETLPANRAIEEHVYMLGLAPLVAHLMVRELNFADRFSDMTEDRLQEFATDALPAHALLPFVINLERSRQYLSILGLLSDRHWLLIRSAEPLISSDLGLAVVDVRRNETRSVPGYYVPLTSHLGVGVTLEPTNVVGGQVQYDDFRLTTDEARDANAAIARCAPRVIFGRQAAVRRAAVAWDTQANGFQNLLLPQNLLTENDRLDAVSAERVHDLERRSYAGRLNVTFDQCDVCPAALRVFPSVPPQ